MESVRHPIESELFRRMKKGKVLTPAEAVNLVRSGDTLAFSGFIGIGATEEFLIALEARFLETGEPRNLVLIIASTLGDGGERGLNRLAHEGLLRRVIAGHYGLTPRLAALATADLIEAYNLPQGVITIMFRDGAARRPRTITRVGLGTFADPRNGGGKMNPRTTEDLVELVSFDGQEYLAYKPQKVQVAVIRATTADLDGNLTFEREALTLDTLPVAMSANNSGGLVIAQVERLADRGALRMREVKVPGILVDGVLVAKPENHLQTWKTAYNPAYAGEFRVPLSTVPPLPLDERKIMARRAAFELTPNGIVNLGLGVPEGVASIASEEGILGNISLTAEPGVIGGMPAGGLDFGAAINVDAIIDMPSQFDFYDGGGLDIAFLGLAQVDREGNVNVSRFGKRVAGAGGFINISQNARKVVFMGTFTTGGLEVEPDGGKLLIKSEGRVRKFIDRVEQITFSGRVAAEVGKPVLYVTERCVFRLTTEGLELVEIAPGIDLDRDILAHMDFRPIMRGKPGLMNPRIFKNVAMGLREKLLSVPIEDRLTYHPEEDLFFVNFEGLAIRSREEIEKIRATVVSRLEPLGRKVPAIVNYDNFDILPELMKEYLDMVAYVVDRFYTKATRYSTGAFMRMKLGDALEQRGLAPHIYESPEEARKALEPAGKTPEPDGKPESGA
jgi:propionate CoA-transferase